MIATAVPAVTSLNNSTINSTNPSASATSTGWDWTEMQEINSSDCHQGDGFGWSVSVCNQIALIGAPFDYSNGTNAGAASIFLNTSTGWKQKVKFTDGETGDEFGRSVSLTRIDEMNLYVALIGAPWDDNKGTNAGAAYAFYSSDNGKTWSYSGKIYASDGAEENWFGWSVYVSVVTVHNLIAIIGAPFASNNTGVSTGAAYCFVYNNLTNKFYQWDNGKFTAPDGAEGDMFGCSVSLSKDRWEMIIGAIYDDDNGQDSGSAYIFNYEIDSIQKILPLQGQASSFFGWSVSIEGLYALVGSPYYYGNGFNSGLAYVFLNTSTGWIQNAILTTSEVDEGDFFGLSVHIAGSRAFIGAPGTNSDAGAAYMFIYDGTSWIKEGQTLKAKEGVAGDHFGYSVSYYSDIALIGAYSRSANGVTNSGAAYVFMRGYTPPPPVSQPDLIIRDHSAGDIGNNIYEQPNWSAVTQKGSWSDHIPALWMWMMEILKHPLRIIFYKLYLTKDYSITRIMLQNDGNADLTSYTIYVTLLCDPSGIGGSLTYWIWGFIPHNIPFGGSYDKGGTIKTGDSRWLTLTVKHPGDTNASVGVWVVSKDNTCDAVIINV